MPDRKPNEKKTEYIPRCIKYVMDHNEADSSKQAYAICVSKWESFNLPIKELTVDDNGIDKISLVESPAIESDFMYFNTDKIKLATINEDKHIITGPAIIPNKLIYRRNELTGDGFYVFFSEETVIRTAELYLKNQKQFNTNIEHEVDVNDVFVWESWIIKDPKNDKANALGFTDLPKGTWIVSIKVDNQEVWDKLVKTKEVKGLSIEGTFLSSFTKDKGKIILNDECKKLTNEEVCKMIWEFIKDI